ncbi:MAG: carboxymuconolactone decarboxylase family protein [Actinobacteria bacterium]|jgi:AhpD family alkylhydroperoxidase|nr:carboxymuconolactone decarboxylase family protein [Micrococcales bacterium]MCB0903529.1 carboxymuconolactone decarboxylase family protein [Actinomycetota bacterium]HRV67030.1 carboxymuconolactone decarboxylase family protein [Candidatus Nanopelagicales bacterium]MCB9428101.1 carboxymuconolactone decarboxylase family protein [Actinomycetota bacterium]HPE13128.1 carboxymuconolactone decarboxylase family protein [Actinomycetota bacterium]
MQMVARHRYSVRDTYRITAQAARTVVRALRGQVQCDQQFAERIRLAVTQVNGCELCAYGHAKFALEAGMDSSEVRDLLGGITRGVPDDQLPAIAFGQHYADTRGHPHAGAWQRIVEQYGAEQALCVLLATRTMMWGNAMGIPLSALRARVQGRPDPNSSLSWEISTTLGQLLVVPAALLDGLLSELRAAPMPAALAA